MLQGNLALTLNKTNFTKVSFHDPARRVFDLIDRFEIQLNRKFMVMVNSIKDDLVLKEIERMLISGRIDDAFTVAEMYVNRFAGQINQVFIYAGQDTAEALGSIAVIDFDITNYRAVNKMRLNKLEFVREFMAEQRIVTRQALMEGVSMGLNPRAQARMFRESIGLTLRQQAAVTNYRRLLQEGSTEALTRRLRDARFDSTVRSSIKDGRPLAQEQIDRMVTRYQERYVKYRSEVIARTESLSAVHEGKEELYQQAFDDGTLDPSKVRRKWHTARDPRVRDTHWPMSGQERAVGEPFTTGAGVSIMYPGDRNAPAKERIQCRCATSTTIKTTQ